MGKFDTHGGYFAPQGYLRVDTGGSHEENPNGGVQLGVDQQGVPNMLEEGEPVYDDYVYSDNIEADEDILKSHGIPVKYAGKLYSKIADMFVDEAEERPNDPISNNGLNAMLVRLADAQEEQKMVKQRQELEEDLENMSPEELAELEALLGQEEQTPVEEVDPTAVENVPISEEAPVEQVMQPEQGMIQSMPGMAFGGYLRRFDGGGDKNGYREAYIKKGEELAAKSDRLGELYDQYRDSKLYDIFNGPSEIVLPDGTVTQTVGGNPITVNAFAIPGYVGKVNDVLSAGRKASKVVTKPKNIVTGLQTLGELGALGWAIGTGATSLAKRHKELNSISGSTDTSSDFDYLDDIDLSGYKKAFGGYLNRYDGLTEPSSYLNLLYPKVDYNTARKFEPVWKDYDLGLGQFTLENSGFRLPDYSESSRLFNPATAYYNLGPAPKGRVADAILGRDGSVLLDEAYVTDKLKKMPSLDNLISASPNNPITLSTHSSVPTAVVSTSDPTRYTDPETGVTVDRGGIKPLATFSRYAGPLMAGIAGIYNAFQKPDHYAINQSQSPIYARGRMDLVNPSFNPLDQNQAVNDVLASGAGTIRALSNSGLGPSAPAAIIAADNNIGRKVGNARTSVWDANNQRRNQVLSMINNNAATKAQFDYGVDRTNAAWANEARNRSIMNDLYVQRLNNQAESEKYAALQRQYDAIAEALSAIGRENVTLNQINSNTALPWNVGHNGWAYYAPSGANTLLHDEDGNEYVMNNDGSLKRV